jgi:hypothetical protein
VVRVFATPRPSEHELQCAGSTPAVLFGNSKPCTRCVHALHEFGVRRVFYTTGKVAEGKGAEQHAAVGVGPLAGDDEAAAAAAGAHESACCAPCAASLGGRRRSPCGRVGGALPPPPPDGALQQSRTIGYEVRFVRELYAQECALGGHTSRGDIELERTLRAARTSLAAAGRAPHGATPDFSASEVSPRYRPERVGRLRLGDADPTTSELPRRSLRTNRRGLRTQRDAGFLAPKP